MKASYVHMLKTHAFQSLAGKAFRPSCTRQFFSCRCWAPVKEYYCRGQPFFILQRVLCWHCKCKQWRCI